MPGMPEIPTASFESGRDFDPTFLKSWTVGAMREAAGSFVELLPWDWVREGGGGDEARRLDAVDVRLRGSLDPADVKGLNSLKLKAKRILAKRTARLGSVMSSASASASAGDDNDVGDDCDTGDDCDAEDVCDAGDDCAGGDEEKAPDLARAMRVVLRPPPGGGVGLRGSALAAAVACASDRLHRGHIGYLAWEDDEDDTTSGDLLATTELLVVVSDHVSRGLLDHELVGLVQSQMDVLVVQGITNVASAALEERQVRAGFLGMSPPSQVLRKMG